MTEEHVERRLGTTLNGKWTLKRVLGVGGMAAVYVGVHKIGREDAIKILHPDVARSPNVRARFEQEAHAANRLKHPGVVEIRDVDTSEDGAPFMVMELLEGESLSSRQRRLGALEPSEVLRFADELLDVLIAAHGQGVIHRDIKPDNLFVLSDGRLKVLDFGIARMKEGAPQTMHTRAGSTLGTVAYMPPEQTMGSKIDERADLFAVGATMFRLLANRYIHEAKSEMDLLVKMASDPAPPLSSVAPHVKREVGLIVDRALAFSRAQRYPDAKTFQSDVRAVRAGGAPSYAEARLSTEGPPAGPSLRGSSAALSFAEGGVEEKPTMPEGRAVSASTPPSLESHPMSSLPFSSVPSSQLSASLLPTGLLPPSSHPASSPPGSATFVSAPTAPSIRTPPISSPPASTEPLAPMPPISEPRSPMPSSPAVSGSASAMMPVLARRADRAKVESEEKRKLLLGVGAGVLALIVGLVIWLLVRSPGETEASSETTEEEPTSAASADPTSASGKAPAKTKGKAKWRKPKRSDD